jgi:hypothetical protein
MVMLQPDALVYHQQIAFIALFLVRTVEEGTKWEEVTR